MNRLKNYHHVIGLVIVLSLLLGADFSLAFAQSRRQPPVSNQKKNKRPEPGKEAEKQEEAPPPDITGTDLRTPTRLRSRRRS